MNIKNNQKGFVVQGIVAVIALVLIAGGAYYFGTKKDDVITSLPVDIKYLQSDIDTIEETKVSNSDIKLYSNIKYGFEFQYPASWIKVEGSEVPNEYNVCIFTDKYPAQDCRALVTVQTMEDFENSGIKNEYPFSSVIINGIEWQKAQLSSGSIDNNIYFTQNNGKIFKINGPTNIAENIISNFKFSSPTVSTADWKTYTNNKGGYSIDYPVGKGWVADNFEDSTNTGFGTPQSKNGGYNWGVSVNNKSESNISDIISHTGDQFKDRKESQQSITIDSLPAILVTVTTNEYPDWTSRTVYVEKDGKIYSISNGAIDSPDFVRFYNSFKFTN
jgi:hypothetical protein